MDNEAGEYTIEDLGAKLDATPYGTELSKHYQTISGSSIPRTNGSSYFWTDIRC